MAVQGVFASDQNIVGTRKNDFAGALLRLHPTGNAQMLALSSGMKSRDTRETIITWFEENHLTGRMSIINNAGSGTAFTLADAGTVIVGQIYLIETSGEYVYVDAVAGVAVTVTRGYGKTAISAIDGSGTPVPMQKITTAFEEGSSRPTEIANLGYPVYNLMQNIRTGWALTRTAAAVQYLGEDLKAKNRQDAAMMHAEDGERAILWGVQGIGIKNGQPFRTMHGLKNMIRTNVKAQGANTKWDDIDQFLLDVFSNNIKGLPNERVGFVGNSVIQVFNKIARLEGQINIAPGQTDFGMEISKWRTNYGTVSLITHPLFNESPHFTKDWMLYHPGAVQLEYLRRTSEDRYDKDGTRAGVDADFGVYTTEMTLRYGGEKTGGYFSGIDTAAAT